MRYFDLTKDEKTVQDSIDELRHTLEDMASILMGMATKEMVRKL